VLYSPDGSGILFLVTEVLDFLVAEALEVIEKRYSGQQEKAPKITYIYEYKANDYGTI